MGISKPINVWVFIVTVALVAVTTFACWSEAYAQEPVITWVSIPTGPHGTAAVPSRYCETNFTVVNMYQIDNVKPDELCVQLIGPDKGTIFNPAFTVTGWYNSDGEPRVTDPPEYGWACWYSYQLGTLSESLWFVSYEVFVDMPNLDERIYQNVRYRIGDYHWITRTAGSMDWMYAGCAHKVYLPVVLKEW